MGYEIYVTNLNPPDHDMLRRKFSAYGKVLKCKIPRDHRMRELNNYGFVTFGTQEEAVEAAVSVNGTYYLNESKDVTHRVTWSNRTAKLLAMDRSTRSRLECICILRNVPVDISLIKIGAYCSRYGIVKYVSFDVQRHYNCLIFKNEDSALRMKAELGEEWPAVVKNEDIDCNRNVKPKKDVPLQGKTFGKNLLNFWTLFDEVRNDLCQTFKLHWIQITGKEWEGSAADHLKFVNWLGFTIICDKTESEQIIMTCLPLEGWPIELIVESIKCLKSGQCSSLKRYKEIGKIESCCIGKNLTKSTIPKYEDFFKFWEKMNNLFPDKFRNAIENAKPLPF